MIRRLCFLKTMIRRLSYVFEKTNAAKLVLLLFPLKKEVVLLFMLYKL